MWKGDCALLLTRQAVGKRENLASTSLLWETGTSFCIILYKYYSFDIVDDSLVPLVHLKSNDQ